MLVDEASRVPDEMTAAVRPMLSVSGGRLVTMSTPWGRRGWWWAAWSAGGPSWERYEVPATACSRIPATFLEQERRSLGDLWYRGEYLCEFTDTIDNVFRSEDVESAFSDGVAPLWGEGE